MKSLHLLSRALKEICHEFAEMSSIHGLKFIMDKQGNAFTRYIIVVWIYSSFFLFFFLFLPALHKIYRTVWILMTCGGLIASNILVATFWDRYKSNPTRLSIESTHVPLNRLFLPAITLCQINRIDYNRAFVLIDKLYKFYSQKTNYKKNTNLLCTFILKTLRLLPSNTTREMAFEYLAQAAGFFDNVQYQRQDLENIDAILAANNITTIEAAKYLHQPCSQLLVRCRFQYRIQPCSELFEISMTYHGSCCTFKKLR